MKSRLDQFLFENINLYKYLEKKFGEEKVQILKPVDNQYVISDEDRRKRKNKIYELLHPDKNEDKEAAVFFKAFDQAKATVQKMSENFGYNLEKKLLDKQKEYKEFKDALNEIDKNNSKYKLVNILQEIDKLNRKLSTFDSEIKLFQEKIQNVNDKIEIATRDIESNEQLLLKYAREIKFYHEQYKTFDIKKSEISEEIRTQNQLMFTSEVELDALSIELFTNFKKEYKKLIANDPFNFFKINFLEKLEQNPSATGKISKLLNHLLNKPKGRAAKASQVWPEASIENFKKLLETNSNLPDKLITLNEEFFALQDKVNNNKKLFKEKKLLMLELKQNVKYLTENIQKSNETINEIQQKCTLLQQQKIKVTNEKIFFTHLMDDQYNAPILLRKYKQTEEELRQLENLYAENQGQLYKKIYLAIFSGENKFFREPKDLSILNNFKSIKEIEEYIANRQDKNSNSRSRIALTLYHKHQSENFDLTNKELFWDIYEISLARNFFSRSSNAAKSLKESRADIKITEKEKDTRRGHIAEVLEHEYFCKRNSN